MAAMLTEQPVITMTAAPLTAPPAADERGPITFEQFLSLAQGDGDYELVDGVLVERMAAYFDHENLLRWLHLLIGGYVEREDAGIVLGSRTAVRIDSYGGRLPDLLYVQAARRELIHEEGILGAPDLVIEVVSPNDRRAHLIGLETDYRRVGVAEIVFIDRPARRVRCVRRRGDEYEAEELETGEITFESLPAITLRVEWLLGSERPNAMRLLNQLPGRP